MPLLHRPTFEKELASELYKKDRPFAFDPLSPPLVLPATLADLSPPSNLSALCLAVFALGARYSSDSRVLLPDVPEESRPYTRGEIYGRAITKLQLGALALESLHAIQMLTIMGHFLFTYGRGALSWAISGIALKGLLVSRLFLFFETYAKLRRREMLNAASGLACRRTWASTANTC